MTDIAFHIFPYKSLERLSKFFDKTIFERKQLKNDKKEDNVTGHPWFSDQRKLMHQLIYVSVQYHKRYIT